MINYNIRQEKIIVKEKYVWESIECWDILIGSKGSLEYKFVFQKIQKILQFLKRVLEFLLSLRGRWKEKQKEEEEDNRVGDEEERKERNINVKRGEEYLERSNNEEGLFFVVFNFGLELIKGI